jgi:ABC-2 type transport system permease protein
MEIVRDGRFRLAALIVLGLLAASLGAGWTHYREVKRQHDDARSETRQQWLTQPPKNPHTAAHYGVYAFKPKLLPSLIDPGVDAFTGVAAFLEPHRQNEFKFKPAQDATVVQRLGLLTAASVLQLYVPLLIILLTFGALAGERESGTLRQTMSLGVPPSGLVWGKALGVTAILTLLLAPAALIGAAALLTAADEGALAAGAWRLLLMAAAYLLYYAALTCVCLTVSALSQSSRSALLTLLTFWMVNSLVAPRVATDLAMRVYPTPSAQEFAMSLEREIESGVDGHSSAGARAEELRKRVLQQYGRSRIEDLPVSFAGLLLEANEEYTTEVYGRHFDALRQQFGRQAQLRQWLGLLAPMLSLRSLSAGLAGSDLAQHLDFAAAAESYRRKFVELNNRDMILNAGSAGYGYVAAPDLWQRVPDFSYAAPGIFAVLRQQTVGVVALWLWLAAAILLLWGFTRRMSC